MRLLLSQAGSKVRIEKQQTNGSTIGLFVSLFTTQKHFAEGAKALGVKAEALLDCVENGFRKRNVSEVDLTAVRTTVFNVREEVGKDVQSCHSLEMALQIANGPASVIEWDNTKSYCCLDVDFHGTTPPDSHALLNFCEIVNPAPSHYWLSKSGGLHAIFQSSNDYTGDEVAAIAAYSINQRFPTATFELLHRTRKPSSKVHPREPEFSPTILRQFMGQAVRGDYTEWLSEHGLTGRERYPHELCPVDPSKRSSGNNDPVIVHPDHIYCFSCAAAGRTFGSAKPGCFPLSALTGERISSAIAVAVENFVHWGHAKYIVSKKIQSESLGRCIYSSLLKVRYPNDERIPLVFSSSPNGLVRYDGYWCDNDGCLLTLDSGSAILQALPHCLTAELQVCRDRVEWLSKPVNHACRGYPALYPIRGLQITSFQELPENKIYTILQTPELTPATMRDKRPKYEAAIKRMPYELPSESTDTEQEWYNIGPEERAWRTLESVFPGIDRRLVELLIVGRGCAEFRSGLPPMLFLTGVTGSGKTSHVQIAASICGDDVGAVPFNKDQERLRQSVIAEKQRAGFLMFDEFFKNARIARVSEVEALETMLSLTPNSTSHQMYIGPVRMGDLPFLLWADIALPLEVKTHEQIGRRMFTHHLHSAVTWEHSLASSGIRTPLTIRSDGTENIIRACNAILSCVIDRHFLSSATDFAGVATALGFKRLRDGDAVDDKYSLLRELFNVICATSSDDTTIAKKFGRGTKLVRCDSTDPLWLALEQCQREDEKRNPVCAMADEADLKVKLKLAHPCKLVLKRVKSGVLGIRFVSLTGERVNEELNGT